MTNEFCLGGDVPINRLGCAPRGKRASRFDFAHCERPRRARLNRQLEGKHACLRPGQVMSASWLGRTCCQGDRGSARYVFVPPLFLSPTRWKVCILWSQLILNEKKKYGWSASDTLAGYTNVGY